MHKATRGRIMGKLQMKRDLRWWSGFPAVCALALIFGVAGGGCFDSSSQDEEQSETDIKPVTSNTESPAGAPGKVTTLPNGLKMEELKVGTGTEATQGKVVVVHYTGWLEDGKKFDSSKDRDQPFRFSLGARQVIAGWDLGVAGMKVGGIRKLTIPPDLGYGARGAGNVIPPNATLVFEVELLEIK